ncbi:NAD(P)/FAD-dependent oxidoreductase [Pseudoalteromonas sp. T1lg75]|uniref:NAD(P)/FAD-dependent oxidoreductase n=1 Tax=Pseudoalteromonas sp. T1lg75 TaxID=2077102 RepID=UPI000CF63F83|nr:FAD-dependent oxidoreductase [Pseudoalteromonas sp. T1lg75]
MTENLWWASAPRLRLDTVAPVGHSTDVVVIGGGFSGLACALRLAEQGTQVSLFEAEQIGHGGSGRNVGLVNALLWLEPNEVLARLGPRKGGKLNAFLAQGPDRVFELIERHRIECEPTRTGTLHCAHRPGSLVELARRQRQYAELGVEARLLDADELEAKTGSSRYSGGLHLSTAGTIEPLAYARGLARAAMRAGVKIYQGARVDAVTRRDSAWQLDVNGESVRCNALVVATNAYHSWIAGCPAPAFTPVHYFQVATAVLSDAALRNILPERQGCWDTAPVMSSWRRDAAGRLILGAVGKLGGWQGEIHTRWARRQLHLLYPELDFPGFEHAWYGRIAYTRDHLPHIVEIGPGAYSLYGYSGRGICPGTLFGSALADFLLSGDADTLPVPLEPTRREAFNRIKGLGYDLGAAALHGAELCI